MEDKPRYDPLREINTTEPLAKKEGIFSMYKEATLIEQAKEFVDVITVRLNQLRDLLDKIEKK